MALRQFRLELSRLHTDQASSRPGTQPAALVQDARALEGTFDGLVVPEATPNPRTVRFMTPTIHDGASRWYTSAADVDDPRVVRLFETFPEVANVLVGPDFVAVGLRRPDVWEQLLDSVLRAVTAEFATTTPQTPEKAVEGASRGPASDARSSSEPRPGTLDRAWRELSALRPDDPRDLERLLAAVSATDVAERQVAARLMVGVPNAAEAETAWSRLLDDPSRTVRRATVDAMVDAAQVALLTSPGARVGRRGRVDVLESATRARRARDRAEPQPCRAAHRGPRLSRPARDRPRSAAAGWLTPELDRPGQPSKRNRVWAKSPLAKESTLRGRTSKTCATPGS